MPESIKSKPSDEPRRKAAVFRPRPMGICILLIFILSFALGMVRQELALVLTGAVFLAIWVYCLVMTLLLAFIHSGRARRAFIRISPREVSTGETVEVVYSEGTLEVPGTLRVPGALAPGTLGKSVKASGPGSRHKIIQLPGILVRCRLLLATQDERRVQYDFNPHVSTPHFFTAEKRGAYFSNDTYHDELIIFDTLGFFRFAFRLSVESGARLLVSPHSADEAPVVNARAGESLLKPEFSFQRTDDLIDHRPYVPGDDPRRINWKLFGHGGGLFVREGEFEPPPQSNIIILIDTEYDPLLYSTRAARRGVDLLCENALAAALACAESGMEAFVGHSGAGIRGGGAAANAVANAAEITASLAWPAAIPLSVSGGLPAVPDKYGILILTLPRSSAEGTHTASGTCTVNGTALDRFLNDNARRGAANQQNRTIEVLFLYDGAASGKISAVAELCAELYKRRFGVKAKAYSA